MVMLLCNASLYDSSKISWPTTEQGEQPDPIKKERTAKGSVKEGNSGVVAACQVPQPAGCARQPADRPKKKKKEKEPNHPGSHPLRHWSPCTSHLRLATGRPCSSGATQLDRFAAHFSRPVLVQADCCECCGQQQRRGRAVFFSFFSTESCLIAKRISSNIAIRHPPHHTTLSQLSHYQSARSLTPHLLSVHHNGLLCNHRPGSDPNTYPPTPPSSPSSA